MRTFLRNTYPVCFLSKNVLLIFKRGHFRLLDLATGDISKLMTIRMSLKEMILLRIPFFIRIMRKGIRCGSKVAEDIIVFVIGHRIFEMDIKNKHISNGFTTSDKSRPLTFAKIEKVKGFKDGIYFGGYKNNPKKHPVSIYRRSNVDEWEEVFQFAENTIEHIHHIIPDPYRNVAYIFTGDFDVAAGIWVAENDFKSVTPILLGNQIYRSCVGYTTKEGLVYATDSPFSQNSIRLLKRTENNWESTAIMDIKGPSIYGCKWGEDFVFSTSVEGGSRTEGLLYMLFGARIGKGVKDHYSHIYQGNLKDGFIEIYRAKKDWLPFFLFQFGALIFPSELNESSYLPVYHVATFLYGMSTFLLKKNKN